jgi:hypothetical protein
MFRSRKPGLAAVVIAAPQPTAFQLDDGDSPSPSLSLFPSH